MLITNLTHEAYYRYLPIPGWDNVKKALYTFANGEARTFKATQLNQVQAMDETYGGGALGLMAAFEQLRPSPSAFVDRLLTEAAAALQQHDQWSRHYDYDGIGPFFKTSVDIGILDRRSQMYYLGLWAAYVGDKPEKALAEMLGIERTLSWSRVEASLAPFGKDSFQIDFDEIVRRLRAVLRLDRKVTGNAIAAAMMKGDLYHPHAKPFVVFRDKVLQVSVAPGTVERRFAYPNPGKPIDTWQLKGAATLTGKLRGFYREGAIMELPTFTIAVTGLQKNTYDDCYMLWESEDKQRALALSAKFQEAFKA